MLQKVVLFGNSLVLSSIGAILRDRPDLEVFVLNETQPGGVERVTALAPDVLVFDLPTTNLEGALKLYKANPDLLLVGVDFVAGQALLLSSQFSSVLTTDDLMQVIETHAPAESRIGHHSVAAWIRLGADERKSS